jgi:hypothetical protein
MLGGLSMSSYSRSWNAVPQLTLPRTDSRSEPPTVLFSRLEHRVKDQCERVFDMAHYLVTAKPRANRLGDLLDNLRKNAYASMRPFGKTLTHSLRNARLREDAYATWEEEDYCSPPLAQERAAALDEFFDKLKVTPVKEGSAWEEVEKLPPLFPELASAQ